jgi:hypothetical protein
MLQPDPNQREVRWWLCYDSSFIIIVFVRFGIIIIILSFLVLSFFGSMFGGVVRTSRREEGNGGNSNRC